MTFKFKLISFTLLLFTIGITLPPSNSNDYNEYNTVFFTSPSVGYDFNIISHKIPFTVKDFVGFKEFLGFFESGSDYKKINRLGYLGKYQFGRSTLKVLRVKKINEFIEYVMNIMWTRASFRVTLESISITIRQLYTL